LTTPKLLIVLMFLFVACMFIFDYGNTLALGEEAQISLDQAVTGAIAQSIDRAPLRVGQNARLVKNEAADAVRRLFFKSFKGRVLALPEINVAVSGGQPVVSAEVHFTKKNVIMSILNRLSKAGQSEVTNIRVSTTAVYEAKNLY